MKVKILYIIDKLDVAGAQRHIVELIRNIDREKYQPYVCCLLHKGPLAKDLINFDVRVIGLKLKKVYGIKGIISLFRLVRFIKQEHFDIVQTYLFSANIFGVLAAKLAGTKLIISCRRDTGMLREGKFRHILAYRLANIWVDKVVCVSNAVREIVLKKEKVDPNKVTVIYNGVDANKFGCRLSAVGCQRNILRKELGIKEDEFVAGIIGSLSWIKGHRDFIEAASIVLKEIPNTRFLIIGDGPERQGIAHSVKNLGLEDKVIFLGKRRDIPELLSIMDVSVNASCSEGMSNTILESMAAGVPVVATAVDGNLETVKSLKNGYTDEEVTGILVPPKNPDAMAEAIIKILKERKLARRIEENARKLIQEKFTSEIMVKNIENLYKQLLRPKIAYILSQFPETYETFILREIRALKDKEVNISIFSLKPCRDKVIHPEAKDLMKRTVYGRLNSLWSIVYSIRYPIRTASSLFYVFKSYLRNPKDLIKAIYVFLECFYFLRVAKKEKITHMHSHWATMPTTCAMILFKLTGVPFSFTAHAWDIFVNYNGLKEKIQRAKFVITCTDYNRRFLRYLCQDGQFKKIYLNYHGIDVSNFNLINPRTLTVKQCLCRILSIGRLVETKGFKYLIDACDILKNRGFDFECSIIGEGPLKNRLQSMVHSQHLERHVKFLGIKTQEEIKALCCKASFLVQPSVMAKNGDRDGIPNVILEAMAMGLPVISTDFSGIPEVVINEKTGILVSEKNSDALANAIEILWSNGHLRETLARNGRQLIEGKFNIRQKTEELMRVFQENGI